jgi:hypothetical protein
LSLLQRGARRLVVDGEHLLVADDLLAIDKTWATARSDAE